MKVEFKSVEETGWFEDYIRITDFAERAVYIEHTKLLELIERLMALAALYKPRLAVVHLHPELCQACKRGDHRFCGMQTWCECEDAEDGNASRAEFEEYHRRHND